MAKRYSRKNPQANKGKNFEWEIEEILKKLFKYKKFHYHSPNDSYMARGNILPSVLSDFLCVCDGTPIALEAKESIEPSLHYKKRLKQLSRLYRYTLANAEAYFLVKHKEKYYALPVQEVWKYKQKHNRKSYPFAKKHKSYDNLEKLLKEILQWT